MNMFVQQHHNSADNQFGSEFCGTISTSSISSTMVIYCCEKCQKIVRQCNVEKHMKRCKESKMKCCDCGKIISEGNLMNHDECEKRVDGPVPSLFNGDAVWPGRGCLHIGNQKHECRHASHRGPCCC